MQAVKQAVDLNQEEIETFSQPLPQSQGS